VLAGTKKVPANKLKTTVAMVAIFAGLQLVWTGTRTLAARRATNTAKITGLVGIGHAALTKGFCEGMPCYRQS